ncbi:MAG: cytochrome b562 [Methylacidiphilales bacterium]|nr:cytochrome b562 [Candidatus Methylacidiphilales bacterium]
MNKFVAITLFCLFCMANFSSAMAGAPLEASMKLMSIAYKQLALDLKQPTDAGKPDYLALAATMKKESLTARGLVPKKVANLPADQQAAMVADYQKSIDALGVTIDALTQDLQNSQWDDATKQMAAIKQQMSNGHKKFRVKQ